MERYDWCTAVVCKHTSNDYIVITKCSNYTTKEVILESVTGTWSFSIKEFDIIYHPTELEFSESSAIFELVSAISG